MTGGESGSGTLYLTARYTAAGTATLTTSRAKVAKIGATVVCHLRSMIFRMAEAAVSRELFPAILRKIEKLKPLVEQSG
jgi:hypothetical protein